ncbi:Nucleotidyltransferase, partial [Glonium stellatum]
SRLHKEICDFYDFVKPHDYEHSLRSELITRISNCLTSRHPNGQVHCFGSFAAGLYLPTADLDLVFVSNSFHSGGEKVFGQNRKEIRKIGDILKKGGITYYDSMEFILGAKVPIIKFVDRITGLKVDMSFEKLDGLITNKTFQVWKARYPVMPTLVTLIKHFLLMRGLNEVVSGGLGGFSVTCLVVSMLQQMPAMQSKNMDPTHNLGDLFMNFLDLYGNKFNLMTTRICMDPAGFVPKGPYSLDGNSREKPNRLSIIDPNAETNDISRGSHQVELVFKLFSESYDMLQQRMVKLQTERTKNASILGTIFAGNYSSFQHQRYLLRTLHDRR